MDNAGKNKKLVKALNSKDWQMYPMIEYTAQDTPQHNHLAEVAIATMYGRARAMMVNACVPKDAKHIIAQKAIETATKLDGLVPITIDGPTKPQIEHWNGYTPPFANHLRRWGEAGVVKTKTATTAKLDDRGIICMFVGYAENHSGDCYEMLNLKTCCILQLRDVQWLNCMYCATAPHDNTPDDTSVFSAPESEEQEVKKTIDSQETIDSATENDAAEDDCDDLNNSEDSHDPDNGQHGNQTRSGCTIKAPTRLIEEIDSSMVEEMMAVGAGIGGGFDHTSELRPMKYEEAMATPKAKQWGESVDMEHD